MAGASSPSTIDLEPSLVAHVRASKQEEVSSLQLGHRGTVRSGSDGLPPINAGASSPRGRRSLDEPGTPQVTPARSRCTPDICAASSAHTSLPAACIAVP